ncbi:unnamed protein product [Caenorhabditis brenneri]
MSKSMQTARMSTGGKAPKRGLALMEELRRQRQLALRKRTEEKAQKAKDIAARYTAEARDERAVRRAEATLRRETEEAAKKNK